MANFSYSARDATGALVKGTIDAANQGAAAQALLGRKLIPVKITAAKNAPTKSQPKSKGAAKKKTGLNIELLVPEVTLADLVIFSRQMNSLMKAGIPILRAVNGLAETSNSVKMTTALEDVADQLERGRNLSSALHNHPKIFDQLFVSIVHVGENTGQLDMAFLQLAEYLEREQETRKQIKSATRYPMFVLIAIVAALVIMNIFVIPTFKGMFEKLGADLPPMTQFLLGMSDFFMTKWELLIAGIVGGLFTLKRYMNTKDGRYRWDRYKLRMPAVGDILERSLLARFCRSFSMMLKAGVPLTHALNLTADAVDNAFVSERIVGMRQNIERGESMARVAASSGLFTPLVMQMINVGEETGRIDELLEEVAEYYEREVDYDLKTLTAKIEPILISIVSAMVLVLALGIFTPMWDMMNAHK
ncbi:type II secretion system F family protein [Planctobacterium marinum]|uniref:type II secretion system F family protein n=1 Tax=Planctobacterium marinum TaxID=1631968 RepID=UPI001E3AC272|nr:type II secretion system F family protein [Planctobacterium marinum]MCC2608024.1 type II secretion system F family protein [Planctobacterium marinum]